jgi:hypothetical protein
VAAVPKGSRRSGGGPVDLVSLAVGIWGDSVFGFGFFWLVVLLFAGGEVT